MSKPDKPDSINALPPLTLHPIGVIRTPFTDRYHAPRQPEFETEHKIEGVIELFKGHNFEQALYDLAGFERIWIVFQFHKNARWNPQVLPPRGPRIKRGVFATRSPYRPNPIGLSVVELLDVKVRKIRVAGVDLLDGTPILDLKPYLPYADSFPDSKVGWLEEVVSAEHSVKRGKYSVEWTPLVLEQIEYLKKTFSIDLKTHPEKVLKHDPTPHPYRRISIYGKTGRPLLAYKSWRLDFELHETHVKVLRVLSGYSKSVLRTASPRKSLHDHEAHEAFYEKWPLK
jgi:tRNA-Thr(GGU) m(6)t(6)A37 methyltransferase TsaA